MSEHPRKDQVASVAKVTKPLNTLPQTHLSPNSNKSISSPPPDNDMSMRAAAGSFVGYTDLDRVYGVSMKFRYHRSTLSRVHKKCYDHVLYSIVSLRAPTIHVPEDCADLKDTDVETIRTAMNYDFPELYGVKLTKTVRIQKKLHSIKAVYKPSFSSLSDTLIKIDSLLAATLNKRISEGTSQNDYLREMTIVAWMKAHCKYSTVGANISNISGFFFDKNCACEGYTRSFLFLCNRLGIPCIFVTGKSNSDMAPQPPSANSSRKERGHCWNMVQLDGIWYYTDITWCSVTGLRHPDTGKVVFPNYFINMPQSLYEILHVADHPFPLPTNPANTPLHALIRHNYYFLTGFVWNINSATSRMSRERQMKKRDDSHELSVANETIFDLCKLILLSLSKGKQFTELLIKAEEPDPFGLDALAMRNTLKDPRLWELINSTLENTQQLNKYILPCGVMVPQGKYPAALVFFKLISTKPSIMSAGKRTIAPVAANSSSRATTGKRQAIHSAQSHKQ